MDPTQKLNAALEGRYRILREVGVGGMATVYLAEDQRHDRNVAIKVLTPSIAASLGPERFLREIQIAASLTHPHILPLHDSGEVDGDLFYVMPFIEGESLRDRMEREGMIPVADTIRILREIVPLVRVVLQIEQKNDPNEQFYNSQNQIELQEALTAIAQQVLPCVIDLNPVPAYPDFVEVTVNGVEYGKMQVMDCATEDGWQFVDDTYMQIELCGQACTDFQSSGNLDAQYKCPGSG